MLFTYCQSHWKTGYKTIWHTEKTRQLTSWQGRTRIVQWCHCHCNLAGDVNLENEHAEEVIEQGQISGEIDVGTKVMVMLMDWWDDVTVAKWTWRSWRRYLTGEAYSGRCKISMTLTCREFHTYMFAALKNFLLNSLTIILPLWKRLLDELKMQNQIIPCNVAIHWNLTYGMLIFKLEYHKAIKIDTVNPLQLQSHMLISVPNILKFIPSLIFQKEWMQYHEWLTIIWHWACSFHPSHGLSYGNENRACFKPWHEEMNHLLQVGFQ